MNGAVRVTTIIFLTRCLNTLCTRICCQLPSLQLTGKESLKDVVEMVSACQEFYDIKVSQMIEQVRGNSFIMQVICELSWSRYEGTQHTHFSRSND